MSKKISDHKPDTDKLISAWNNLDQSQKSIVNQFLCLREMTYDKYKDMSDEAKEYIKMLFPESVSKS